MRPAGPLWLNARLRATRDLTPDIRLFELEPTADFRPPTPGSHIKIVVHIDGRPDLRSYSTVGPSTDGLYRIAVKRAPVSRGGSAYLWRLAPNALLSISAPDNHFPLNTASPEHLLIAGGIGITPIYSMALTLARTSARFRLLYACRSTADAAFACELRSEIGDRLHLRPDDAGSPIDLDTEIARLHPQGELYVCGPLGLLNAAKSAWRRAARPPALLRFETFGNSGRLAAEPFTATIPRLGLQLTVPANRSLLEALEAAGVAMIADCRRGECGLCALPIRGVTGTVDHRDVYLSDDEKAANTQLCTCVSRVSGSITLDTGDR